MRFTWYLGLLFGDSNRRTKPAAVLTAVIKKPFLFTTMIWKGVTETARRCPTTRLPAGITQWISLTQLFTPHSHLYLPYYPRTSRVPRGGRATLTSQLIFLQISHANWPTVNHSSRWGFFSFPRQGRLRNIMQGGGFFGTRNPMGIKSFDKDFGLFDDPSLSLSLLPLSLSIFHISLASTEGADVLIPRPNDTSACGDRIPPTWHSTKESSLSPAPLRLWL